MGGCVSARAASLSREEDNSPHPGADLDRHILATLCLGRLPEVNVTQFAVGWPASCHHSLEFLEKVLDIPENLGLRRQPISTPHLRGYVRGAETSVRRLAIGKVRSQESKYE